MTQKIVASVVRIAAGKQDKLDLGNVVDLQRDWGWAEDYSLPTQELDICDSPFTIHHPPFTPTIDV